MSTAYLGYFGLMILDPVMQIAKLSHSLGEAAVALHGGVDPVEAGVCGAVVRASDAVDNREEAGHSLVVPLAVHRALAVERATTVAL